MSSKKVLVSGSLAFDLIMDFPGKFADHIDPTKLHILNISFLVDSLKKESGGNAGNISYTLSLLGVPAAVLGAVGEDFESYKKFLDDAGVETENIKVIPNESTATAIIMTDKSDNQITAFYPGAMKKTTELNLNDLQNLPDFLVISPDLPETMVKLAKESKEKSVPYLYDPGMQLPRLADEQILEGLDGAEILIGNDYEMGIIKKRLNLTDEDLLKKVKVLITTLGEKGSVILTGDEKIETQAGKPKEVLDPTGAGDAYRAGFLAGYLRGFDLKVCGQMGSIASCYTIEKYGTTTHKFSLEEFTTRYKENFGERISLTQP